MRLYSIYFSPTGGTKKIADILCETWSQAAKEVDLSNTARSFSDLALTSEDVCLIAVPSFGGRVPAVALSRLSLIQANGATAILLVSFGNRAYDDTLLELQDAAQTSGFHVKAAVAAVAEHSILRQFGTGRPDAADIAELRTFAPQIRATCQGTNSSARLSLPGHRPFVIYQGVPLKPNTDKSCNDCGICAERCPVLAIPAEQPAQTDTKTCISCMRCIAICPLSSRSLSKTLLFGAGQQLKKACAERKSNALFLAR